MTTPQISGSPHDQASGTARFYTENATQYACATRNVDMSAIYSHFLEYLKPDSRILDAGSGSGRDTRAFLKRGYRVEAFDESAALAELSSQWTGIRTRVLQFEEFDDRERFDGIWSCASLLHVPRDRLSTVLTRLVRGLKVGGVLYASFKRGTQDRGTSDGRIFTDLDEQGLSHLVTQIPYRLEVRDMWQTQGEGVLEGSDVWLNTILQRCT